MPPKKKPADDTIVAKTAIAIEGKHFSAGDPITGVSEEEIGKAFNAKRACTLAEFSGKGAAEPEADEAGEQS